MRWQHQGSLALNPRLEEEIITASLTSPPLDELCGNYAPLLNQVPPPKEHSQQALKSRERDLQGEKQKEERGQVPVELPSPAQSPTPGFLPWVAVSLVPHTRASPAPQAPSRCSGLWDLGGTSAGLCGVSNPQISSLPSCRPSLSFSRRSAGFLLSGSVPPLVLAQISSPRFPLRALCSLCPSLPGSKGTGLHHLWGLAFHSPQLNFPLTWSLASIDFPFKLVSKFRSLSPQNQPYDSPQVHSSTFILSSLMRCTESNRNFNAWHLNFLSPF